MKKGYRFFMSIVMVIVMSITMPFSSASAILAVPLVNEQENNLDKSTLAEHGIIVTPSDETFRNSKRLVFCVYCTIAEVCRSLEYAVQANNPECFFDAKTQTLSTLILYLNYYSKGSFTDLRLTLEDYTDTLIAALLQTYPKLDFNSIMVNWKIPAVDPDSLYTASYWCEPVNGIITRGSGKGVLYR